MMMNIRIIISAIVLSGIISLSAVMGQNNKVSNAIQAFAAGEYQKAYELSGDALANVDELSGDYVAAAYYYLAKSRVQILRLAMEGGDQEILSGMQNALIESYYDYTEALKTADNKLKTDISADLSDLYNPILQTGLAALNTANDPKQPNNVREAALKAAAGYLAAAKDISPTYLACDLLGQAHYALGDTLKAQALFNESIYAYKSKPPAQPDFLMTYVFFRKALIERQFF
jgi:tetratricopeptide (TPR) repeat protein